MKYVVALGSNQGESEQIFNRACEEIAVHVGKITATSLWHRTKALVQPGAAEQPDYLNGVVLVESSQTPQEVMRALLAIEARLGRVRDGDVRWQPRTIDLDIVAADMPPLKDPLVTIPHPEMHKRAFVLKPLSEVWPEWRHPVLGRSVGELLAAITA